MLLLETTTTLIIGVVQFLIAFGVSVFGLIKVVEAFTKEHSVGKAAIDEMRKKNEAVEKDLEKMKRQIDELENDNEELKRTASKLYDDFKEMMKTQLQYLQGRNR